MNEWKLKVEGHDCELFCGGYRSKCGDIRNGVQFHFVDKNGRSQGGWVVRLSDLARIVAEATKEQGL